MEPLKSTPLTESYFQEYKEGITHNAMLIALDEDHIIVVDFIGPELDYFNIEIDELYGLHTKNFLDIEGEPGIYIWEGRLKESWDPEKDYEHESWLEGSIRKMTKEEIDLYYDIECPWDQELWLIPLKAKALVLV